MGFLSNLFGGLGSALSGAGSSIMSGLGNLAKPIMSMFSGGSGGGSPIGGGNSTYGPKNVPVGFPANAAKGGSGIANSLFPGGVGQGIAGIGMPFLGDMFAPKSPKIPKFGDLESVQAMQSFKPGKSVSPEYQQMLQRNTQQLRDTKVRELQALYHNARPGTDYLTDSNYQRDLAKVDQDIQTNMSDDLARAEATFSSQEQDRLSQLAQMDIYSIMAQTGLEAQEAQDFKEMFSNIGNTFLTNATRNPNDMSSLMSMFGGR